MKAWLLAFVVAGVFSPVVCFGQDAPAADTDAVLKKAKPALFSFRDITFGTGVDKIPGLVKRGDLHPSLNPGSLVWYVRENEKPMNDVAVVVHFGFYNGKLVKLIITVTGPPAAGWNSEAWTTQAKSRIDEALIKKYGNPQLDICKKEIAKLWGSRDMKISEGRALGRIGVKTKDGTWCEEFPSPPTMQTWPHWWLFDERVLVASVASGAGGGRIEIKDVPMLVAAMKSEAKAYKDEKEGAAKKSAKEDF